MKIRSTARIADDENTLDMLGAGCAGYAKDSRLEGRPLLTKHIG
jgi:hypothetical protein